jgi:hypothetical protein
LLREISMHVRTGPALWLSEVIATCGLLLVVPGHRRSEDAPRMVAARIGAGSWLIASTSFANPVIAIACSLSNTFAGIGPADVTAFVAAEVTGVLVALVLGRLLFSPRGPRQPDQRSQEDTGRSRAFVG